MMFVNTRLSIGLARRLRRRSCPYTYFGLLALTLFVGNDLNSAAWSSELASSSIADLTSDQQHLAEQQLLDYLNHEYPDQIAQVEVKKDSIVLAGKVGKGSERRVLLEIPLYSAIPSREFEVIELSTSERGEFQVEVPRRVGKKKVRDRLLSKWVLGSANEDSFQRTSPAHLPDKIVAKQTLPPLPVRSKKGLGGFSASRGPISDLDDLGITSVTVNVKLDFLSLQPSEDTAPFEYSGRKYYVDQKAIAGYDRTFLETAKRDILTLAILLLPPPEHFPDKGMGRLMCHPDYDSEGIFAMPNVVTSEGHACYCAAIEYLASRYCQPDAPFGRIHHWILHNECDAGWVWTNAGQKSMPEYLDLYYRSMRTVHNITRCHDPHSQVFISLTHFWDWTENEKFYLPHKMLDLLCRISRTEGDFDWGIAYHPYPESLFVARTWEDKKASATLDTSVITMKNIEVLEAWARQAHARFRGKRVRIIHLTEQGFNSPEYNQESLENQAAAMVYAWQKLKPLSSIAAFQYHNWIDNRHEGGLRIGLRKFPDDPHDPAGKKPIWYLYRDLATEREAIACEFAKSVLGAETWSELIADPASK